MKLEELNLRGLSRLRRFCKESYNFKFPVLQTYNIHGEIEKKIVGMVTLIPLWKE
ncbi:hypothetical protein AAZX31_15G231800 [Glycine max]